MILADTSVWIAHIRYELPELKALLQRGQIVMHPLVMGELAVGNLRNRDETLGDLADLPQAREASHADAMEFLDAQRLWGRGVSYFDLHLLTSARLTVGSRLWTADHRLGACAEVLGLRFAPVGSA